jgi:hypothetical protein
VPGKQWKKYADLENEKTLQVLWDCSGGAMWAGGAALTSVAIAMTVVMLHLG